MTIRFSIIFLLIPLFQCLSQNELNELARKFKYYHSAVRPAAPDNFVSDRNGTFFNIPVEIHLLESRIVNRQFHVELVLIMRWCDERLRLRELTDRFSLPADYTPWMPSLNFGPSPTSKFISLTPTTGVISVYHTMKTTLDCTADAWKYPFERFRCHVLVSVDGDELLTISMFHDLRPAAQQMLAEVTIGDYPHCSVSFSFKSEWPRAVLAAFLPSVLLISSVFFAQWKRRKVQVLVSLSVMICILIMLCSQRPYTAATLMDFWLCANFVHSVFLVLIDLTLPARRVRYTLMVHVDEKTEKANPVQIMTTSETEHVGPFRYMHHVINYLLRRDHKPKTTIVTASPGPTPIQRQITTAMLGNRKKTALVFIAISYILFLLIYATIFLAID